MENKIIVRLSSGNTTPFLKTKKNIPDRSVITNFRNNAIIMTFFSIGIKTETGVKEVLDR